MTDRRSLLRGLVTLPLIGGGVTLIGRPAARVALADVAVAPIATDPHQRARYAWEAFSAAMREITAGSDGWRVQGGESVGKNGARPREAWMDMRSVHKVPLGYPSSGFSDQLAELELG